MILYNSPNQKALLAHAFKLIGRSTFKNVLTHAYIYRTDYYRRVANANLFYLNAPVMHLMKPCNDENK